MKAPSTAPPRHRIFHFCYSCRTSFLSSSESTSLRRHGPSDDVGPSPPKKPRPDCSDAQKAAYMNNFSNRGTAAEDGPTKAEAANARHSLLPPPASAAALLHRISRLVPHRPQIYLSAPPWTLGKRQARRRRIIGSSRQEPMSRSREEVCV